MAEEPSYSSIGNMLTDTANAALSQTSTSRKAKSNARKQAKAQRELEKDQEARPYAYQQQAVRNAYTLGAPADDRGARARAMSAQAIYNDLERNNASPEELAAAQQEYKQWANWASMSRANRENILQRGRKQAEMGAAKNQFAGIMNERQTPGAAELLQYEADVMAGRNPNAFKSETSSTGRKVVYKDGIPVGFSGAPPSQIIGDAGERSMVNRTGLLSPQERQAIRDQAIAEAVNPTRPVQPKPVARQILENFQGARPSVTPMNFGESLNDAYSMLNAPATPVAVAPVAPAPAVASSQPALVVPVAGAPAPQQPMGTSGRDARGQLATLARMSSPLLTGLAGTANAVKSIPGLIENQEDRDLFRAVVGQMFPAVGGFNAAWNTARGMLQGK